MGEWDDFKTTLDSNVKMNIDYRRPVNIGTLNKEAGKFTFKKSRKSEDTVMKLHPKWSFNRLYWFDFVAHQHGLGHTAPSRKWISK